MGRAALLRTTPPLLRVRAPLGVICALSTPPSLQTPRNAPPFSTVFQSASPVGPCVAVRLPECTRDELGLSGVEHPMEELHPSERKFAQTIHPSRRLSFVGGRLAMRRVLSGICADSSSHAVLPNASGAPAGLPPGIVGSISHTRDMAVAVVRHADEASAVGVDIESASRLTSLAISRKILGVEERAHFGSDEQLSSVLSPERELLIYFSVKEALYKALHPLVQQHIGWHSVTVRPRVDGTCEVALPLVEQQAGVGIRASAYWSIIDGYILTTAEANAAK